MDETRRVVDDGVIYVEGDSIAAVAAATAPPPGGFAEVEPVATGGSIYPGLIELHNHLPYNALPLMRVPTLYTNRGQWRGTKGTQRFVSGPAGVLARVDGAIQATVRYVECKSLVGGVTTSQGITLRSEAIRHLFRGVVRNAELPDDLRLPPAKPRIEDVLPGQATAFNKTLARRGARLLHLSEGTDAASLGFFNNLRFKDEAGNSVWAINERFIGIHATALGPAEMAVLGERGGHIVWSPFSNLALYGSTTDVATARDKGVVVALGSDWAPSGSKNLLGELKVARLHADHAAIDLDDRALVEMVTINPAVMLGWDALVGSLVPRRLADLTVIAGTAGDPYHHLVAATESAVSLVVIGGRARYGRPELMAELARVTDTTEVTGVAKSFSLDVEDPVLGAVRLDAAIATLTRTLGSLVDLAQGFAGTQLGAEAASLVEGAHGGERWLLDLDLDLPDPFDPTLLAGSTFADIAVNLVLDPLTVEGDDAFFAQLANLANVPAAIRNGLPAFYGEQPRDPSPIGAFDDDGDEIETDPALDLATLRSLPPVLTLRQRRLIVAQAILVLQEFYAHLDLKAAMYAVDPVKRLRLLQRRLAEATTKTMGSEVAFHDELNAIFTTVRDLHTHYVRPEPLASHIVYLPFLIEECVEAERRRFKVTKLARGFSRPPFAPGVDVTHWNGVPVAVAAAREGERQSGSNAEARFTRGLDALMTRQLSRMAVPDEEWVTVTYATPAGEVHELRLGWLVRKAREPSPFDADEAIGTSVTTLGIDVQTEAVNNVRRDLYRRPQSRRSAAGVAALDDEIPTSLPGVFRARRRRTAHGLIAHVRIFTFHFLPDAVIEVFARLLEDPDFPPNGLILDVRGNGGGYVHAAEGLLQFLTPRRIEPQPAQFRPGPLVRALCERNAPSEELPGLDLGAWIPSIREAVQTEATYSRGFPMTTVDDANAFGQRYWGPVVLVTDARCYSATDIFAAGFKDHDIGPVLGTARNTGAGGANVWTHALLHRLVASAAPELRPLPEGVGIRVALRRTTRVGAAAGTPLEDLGVVPDHHHSVTARDVLSDNEDLLDAAGALLVGATTYVLNAELTRHADQVAVTLRTRHLDRVDALVDDRPVASLDVNSDSATLELAGWASAGNRLALAGYDAGRLAAARVFRLPPTG